MDTIALEGTRSRISTMLPLLGEKQRRIFLATEAITLGYGGVKAVSAISGMSRTTITQGIKEIEMGEANNLDSGRNRRKGGGRKPISEKYPGLKEAIASIVDAHTKGSPVTPLMWTSKSVRNISDALSEIGMNVNYVTVSALLKEMGYSLQSNRKDLAISPSHPDRDKQFEYINEQSKLFFLKGCPVLSIDAKKKEKIGNFINGGREYHRSGDAPKVLDHDFPIKELGKATPFGVYDIFKNCGFVSVGISADTAQFAAESLRKWFDGVGAQKYPEAREVLITADCGGSNGYRVRLWKTELQKLANQIGKEITILHFPPGTSKWNKIEHRLFSFISKNWRGRPLLSLALIIDLISATKTGEGLSVECVVDENDYKRGIVVSDDELAAVNIRPHLFHGEWNYTILPSLPR